MACFVAAMAFTVHPIENDTNSLHCMCHQQWCVMLQHALRHTPIDDGILAITTLPCCVVLQHFSWMCVPPTLACCVVAIPFKNASPSQQYQLPSMYTSLMIVCCVAAIPFIVHPIDNGIHAIMNFGFRPAVRSYICGPGQGNLADLNMCDEECNVADEGMFVLEWFTL